MLREHLQILLMDVGESGLNYIPESKNIFKEQF
jgi:hypothetical protein